MDWQTKKDAPVLTRYNIVTTVEDMQEREQTAKEGGGAKQALVGLLPTVQLGEH